MGKPHAPPSHGLTFYGVTPREITTGMPFTVVIIYSTNHTVIYRSLDLGNDEMLVEGEFSPSP